MRLSRAYIPLASEDRTHSQAIYTYPHNNLAPHFLPGFINLQHFRHSRWRNPVRLSKMGTTGLLQGYYYRVTTTGLLLQGYYYRVTTTGLLLQGYYKATGVNHLN